MSGRAVHMAISGAGVGGMTAALALAQAGLKPALFERYPAPRAGGGPIWLYENALGTLAEIGLEETVKAAGTLIQRHSYRDWRGREIGIFPLAELGRRRGAPTRLLMIARNALDVVLRTELTATAGEDVLHYDCPVAGYTPTRGGVQVLCGPTMTSLGTPFDGLIGSDGVRSVVRCQLLGPEPLIASYMAWTGGAVGASWPYPAGESVTYLGNGFLLIAGADTTSAERVLWVAIGPAGDLAKVERTWPEPIVDLLRHTPEPVPFWIRSRTPRWRGRGPVTLAGDAAHPMMPGPGQGACMAIEDGVALARALSRRPSVESALRSYEEERQQRVPRIWHFSRSVTLMMLTAVPSAAFQASLRLAVPWVLDEYLFILDRPRADF
jgi:2-polyprenyl-6-methoxyphenol hydroxylase-like FAD-dependent oxidoreductase